MALAEPAQGAQTAAAASFAAALAVRAPRLRCDPEADADGPFLAELFATCSPLRDMLPPAVLLHQAQMQRAGHRAQYPDADWAVLAIDAVPVARIGIDWSNGEAVLVDIAVEPARQSAGLGTAILSAMLDVADARARRVRLMVSRDNPAARLYARLGFVATGGDGHQPFIAMIREPHGAS